VEKVSSLSVSMSVKSGGVTESGVWEKLCVVKHRALGNFKNNNLCLCQE
jgi:hypothetical protein